MKMRRTATVQAKTYCNLYSLDQSSLFEVLKIYPSVQENLYNVAEERLEHNLRNNDELAPSTQQQIPVVVEPTAAASLK